ncbi:ABC transporter substrate-binding protein [Saccharibacillus sp. CPCC 101409]|uniref:ABC transporter substrate-binding protein n=1 Tax=Saccharibacillus sp. CPCC 101409 TaxID=3058041 RepID=UPI00267243B3|nr:ABC transporter substrate-binding protein [Saccharibacillus sp. CPCC 101409]MDO3412342.1 ABC transporter substrate-binding protein [Saccharibacillus sp. CPCC 101409]
MPRQPRTRNRIRLLFCFMSLLAAAASLTGCSLWGGGEKTGASDNKPVNLIYYTIGEPDKDLQLVNDRINEILAAKIGVTVTYIKVGWQEYEGRLNTMVSAGTPFDIAYTPDYTHYIQQGALLRLNDYLSTVGKEMTERIDPVFWEGMTMNDGGIYGVPTNKELAMREQWMYPDELVNKYGIPIARYNTLESLEPLLKTIKEKEPSYQPMQLDKDSHNFFALDGYEYVVDKKIPLMAQSQDSQAAVVNIFETGEAKKVLNTLRRYYQAGYINEDAALRESQGLKRGEKVFWKAAGGGPLSESSWSKDRGYKVDAHPVTPVLVTTESVRGGIMAVSADTQHPVECMKFLNALNTDPEIRNLFNYGIEGVHYNLDESGQVVPIRPEDSEASAGAPPDYAGVQYTQGNWFILKTMGGDVPDPPDKWEQFRESNSMAVKSGLLGFTPDLSHMPIQRENIEMVWDKYYPGLMTGSLDVETELPKFNEELRRAGIDEVKAEVQKQLDEWRAERSRGL